MLDFSSFPITQKWPATREDVIQVYGFPSPNSGKVVIALEELGLDYEFHYTPFGLEGVKSPEFLTLSPNGKMPAIIDPNGSDGPIGMFESGAILIYLAEKSGRLIPDDVQGRFRALQWLMWQMGGLGPMVGQVGYFHAFAGKEIEDPRPKARFIDESKRLLDVLEKSLEGKDWIAGQYSIADIAIGPWLKSFGFYGARDLVEFDSFAAVNAYYDRFFARPAVQRAEEKLSTVSP